MRNDWIKIKNYYIHHSISLEDLAKRFKVSTSAVNKHCRLEKWVSLKEEKSKEIDKQVSEKTTQKVIDKKVLVNEKHNELYDKGLKVAEMILDNFLAELAAGKKKTKATAYNLNYVMKAIADAQKGQRLSLNIGENDTEDVEPEVKIINGLDISKI